MVERPGRRARQEADGDGQSSGWPLPVIEPSYCPGFHPPLTRAPVWARVPRKVRLVPLREEAEKGEEEWVW